MEGQNLDQSFNSTTSYNTGYNNSTALKIRLETNQLMENVELFLRGSKLMIYQDDKGKIVTKTVSIGQAKANDIGIQSLLNWMQLILNPQVVQGNFPADAPGRSYMYEDYIYFVRVDAASMIVTNCYTWGIADADIDVIIDCIMNAIEPFMTRLIDNKERESYDNTVKHLESNTIKEGGENKFRLFGN